MAAHKAPHKVVVSNSLWRYPAANRLPTIPTSPSRVMATSSASRTSPYKSSAQSSRYTMIHRFFTAQAPRRPSLALSSSVSPSSWERRAAFCGSSHCCEGQRKGADRTSRNGEKSDSTATPQNQDKDSDALYKQDQPFLDPRSAFANYPRSLRDLAIQARSSAASSVSSQHDDSSSPPTNQSHQHSRDQQAGQHNSYRRPSKEDLLRYARGFWTRLRIRFKWFTIRGFRRFNADDFSAFFTLGGLGTIVLIVIGTTTAVSVVLWGLDRLGLQQWIARKIADHLTAQTGVTVVFESAIVPKWKDSRICFQNVFITRRANAKDPESLKAERDKKKRLRLRQDRERRRQRRGTASTAGQGMAWEGVSLDDDPSDSEGLAPPLSSSATGQDLSEEERGLLDTNFTMFDLNFDSIDVTLSISRWFDGKGLIEDAVVKGVRGIIDRRNVYWDPDRPYDPRAARRTSSIGDFELEHFEVHDLLVTIYQPGHFRPFNLSIFDAVVPKLRKQWLFYDWLSAESITGQVDGCLFSLHKPQSIGRTTEKERALSKEGGRWRTISRLRVDGVNVDHIQNQSDLSGPLSWILSGRFDVVADIRFPRDTAAVDINTIIAELVDNLANAVAGNAPSSPLPETRDRPGDHNGPIPGQHELNEPAIQAPLTAVGPAAEKAWRESKKASGLSEGVLDDAEEDAKQAAATRRQERRKRLRAFFGIDQDVPILNIEDGESGEAAESEGDTGVQHETSPSDPVSTPAPAPLSVVIDLDVRFKDIKAAVPLSGSELTYSKQAFVRPIVAFMNANRTLIPVHCRVVMDLSEFDGSMDLAQTGLLPLVSEKLHEALAHHVTSSNANSQRLKSVTIWSLHQTLHAVLKLATQLRDSMSGVKTHSSVHAASSAPAASVATTTNLRAGATGAAGGPIDSSLTHETDGQSSSSSSGGSGRNDEDHEGGDGDGVGDRVEESE